MAEEVFLHLGRRPASAAAPPTFVVLSVAEQFLVDSSGSMPALQSVKLGSQRYNAWHQNRSLGLRLALESVAEVLAALVGLSLCLGC